MPEFVRPTSTCDGSSTAPPCIDPLSVKNLDLGDAVLHEIVEAVRHRPDRPIVCQVSRFDPWKDPVGVIEAYRTRRGRTCPDVQLVLAGSMATDDPEGFQVWEQVAARRRRRPRHPPAVEHPRRSATCRSTRSSAPADVVIQKSLREGFGLTVSEGLWKGRPVIGGRVGGITLQIGDTGGYLVDSVEERADACAELLGDAGLRHAARRGRPRARAAALPVDARGAGSPVRCCGPSRRTTRACCPRASRVRRDDGAGPRTIASRDRPHLPCPHPPQPPARRELRLGHRAQP